MTISIWGKFAGNPPELIDRASSVREARYLAGEYQMAYGQRWHVWYGRRDGTPPAEKKPKRLSYWEYKREQRSISYEKA